MINLEEIRNFCLSLPAASENVKWGHDLCFCVADKMFCVTALEDPWCISFKVTAEEFDEISNSDGFGPAPYVARYKWVLLQSPNKISKKRLLSYIQQSYNLVKSKLPKGVLKTNNLL